MHISDGILSPAVCAGGYVGAALLGGFALKKTDNERIPQVAVMSAVFFVSSLIHLKIGPTAIHLIFLGLTGIILGPLCPLAFFTGLFFQAVMFGHGGLTTLGVNTVLMSVPALIVHSGFTLILRFVHRRVYLSIAAGLVTFIGIFIAAASVLGVLYASSREFAGLAVLFSSGHAVLAVIEGAMTGAVVFQLLRIKPEMIHR